MAKRLPFYPPSLSLIHEREGARAVMNFVSHHGYRLISCRAPLSEADMELCAEIDGFWYRPVPCQAQPRRAKSNERQR